VRAAQILGFHAVRIGLVGNDLDRESSAGAAHGDARWILAKIIGGPVGDRFPFGRGLRRGTERDFDGAGLSHAFQSGSEQSRST
jgi:hypothetical protein